MSKYYSARLLFAMSMLFYGPGCDQSRQEQSPPPPPMVTVATPVNKNIVEWDAYTGRFEAIEFVEIRSRVGGYLQSIHFDEGQVVNKGDLLFIIDPRPFVAELNDANASLRQAESQLLQAKAQMEEAKAAQQQSNAQLTLAETRVARVRDLRQQEVTTQDELDQREAEYLQAQADGASSLAGISSANAAIATANAAIDSAKAKIETAALNLQYTKITAPVTGRISREYITEGNLITGGTATSSLLTTITSVQPIYCMFDANEQEVLKYTRLAMAGRRESSRVAKNPVYLGLVDESDYPHEGHMDFVDNRFDTDTASMRARCVFPNKDQVLLPGMFARIRIPGSSQYEAILIPDSAIGTDQNSQYVYVVVDDVIERRVVTVGPIVDGLRVVREGLNGDETLVIEGLLLARPDAKVQTREGTIVVVEDGLPDTYEPLPPEKWISPEPDPLPEEEKEITGSTEQGGGR
ncbi:efflux RND transporter periplasmic adaptor subunit [Rubinisphaera italica]|uniref:Multidrug resistance protein MexA n=1 Tax=Rubinisphaera italica TaxID=2527969 RepID=A0A5C5XQ42_9PLAN|nr:efflux RND transporter periplasmic adaptor subunit [Rubinisphaera italica]TWT63882.1 Multidrug resistance protein MexA precursor [Rubinisphaera italica]